jgi:hypothetical protein
MMYLADIFLGEACEVVKKAGSGPALFRWSEGG